MRIATRSVPPALFVLAALSFLLPFLTVSCQGRTLVRLTGAQLVTGTRLDLGHIAGATGVEGVTIRTGSEDAFPFPGGADLPPNLVLKGGERTGRSPIALAVLLCTVIGFCFAWTADRTNAVLSGLLAAAGAVLLLALKSGLSSDLSRATHGFVTVRSGVGFWAAGACLLLAAGVQLVRAARTASSDDGVPAEPVPAHGSRA